MDDTRPTPLFRTLVAPSRQHVEGTVLAMLSLVIVSHVESDRPFVALAATSLFTIAVYWLANVYADVLSRPHVAQVEHRSLVRLVGGSMVHELALVTPGLALLLLAGAVRLLGASLPAALWTMLVAGNVTLFCWGLATARRIGSSLPAQLAFATAGACIGLLVVAGKLLLH